MTPDTQRGPDAAHNRLEQVGTLAVFGVAGALQFSIAAAQILLAVAALCWLTLLVMRREPFAVPAVFWPLLLYAGITLVSAVFSIDPGTSLLASKQLVLYALVPVVYRFARGASAPTVVTVILTCGAASAVIGIAQYGIFHYDNLGQRPQGLLGHYMTYSGLLMLVMTAAFGRLLFGARDRVWAALVVPALAVAVALTFTRSAWVGTCVAVALLFALRDFRLFAFLPIVAAIFFALAPATVSARFVSMFDLKDPTNRDRVAMLRGGAHMALAHPLVGVGPNMVQRRYEEYRDPNAVEPVTPHLHNVPAQIAAERGLPALAIWLSFVAALFVTLARRFRRGDAAVRCLAATGLAALSAMLTAGLFEYNFGDSEFLMLFLVLVTLPFAAERGETGRTR